MALEKIIMPTNQIQPWDHGQLGRPQLAAGQVRHQPIGDAHEGHGGGRGHGQVEVAGHPGGVVDHQVDVVGGVGHAADAAEDEKHAGQNLDRHRGIAPGQLGDPPSRPLPPRCRPACSSDATTVKAVSSDGKATA
jgi:hypothetical protein